MEKPYFAVQWHITDICDQRCRHCYIYASNSLCVRSMPYDEMLGVLNNIEEFCEKSGRTPYIYLTGGDPVLHPDFRRLLTLLARRKIRFCIMGNPYHLTEESCVFMRGCGCVKYQLSLDGLEKTHDALRRPGSFRTTLEKIPVIRNAGMWCAVMTTVSGTNMPEIPRVDIYAVGRYCPTSREKAFASGIHIPPHTYRTFLEACWERYCAHRNGHTVFQLKDHLWTLFLYEKGLFRPPAGDCITDGCNCGRNHVTILPNGDLYACRRMESKIGNLSDMSLYEAWTSEAMNGYRQYSAFEKCGRCELKNVCRGCPAVTFGYTGSMYGADPQCWKEV